MKPVIVLGMLSMLLLVCLVAVPCVYAEPANTYVYVGSHDSNTVSVLDPITNLKITDIRTPSMPYYVLVNPAGTMIAITSRDITHPYIDFYSTIDYSLLKSIYAVNVTGITFDNTGSRLYVSQNTTPNCALSIIDMATYTTIKSINMWTYAPGRVLYYNNSLYVDCRFWPFSANGCGVILKYDRDLENVIGSPDDKIKQQLYSYSMFVDRTNNKIIVSADNATLWGFNADTLALATTFNTGRNPALQIFGADVNSTGYVYAGVYATPGTICVLRPDGTILTNYTGTSYDGITDLTINMYNRTLYICNYNNNIFSVVNTDTGAVIVSGMVGNAPFHISIGTQANKPQHQVKFVIQSLFGLIKYNDVNVTVYDHGNWLLFSQNTDTTGQAAFYMDYVTRYTVRAYSIKDKINQSIQIVPYDDTYYIEVIPFIQSWNPLGWLQSANTSWTGLGSGDVNKDIRTNYSVNHTQSPRLVTINYGDASASTTAINYTLARYWYENKTYTVYNTTIISGSGLSYRQEAFSIPATLADGQSWRFIITSQSDAYGTVVRSDDYHFPGASYPIPGVKTEWYPYICFGFTIIVALAFTYISSGLGLIVIAGLNVLFMLMGWLAWSDMYLILLQVLGVFGAGAIFKQKKRQEGL